MKAVTQIEQFRTNSEGKVREKLKGIQFSLPSQNLRFFEFAEKRYDSLMNSNTGKHNWMAFIANLLSSL